jgi:hypothetical protein
LIATALIPNSTKEAHVSHIVTVKAEIKNPVALTLACARLGLVAPKQGNHKLYSGKAISGLAISLPGWKYPVVVDSVSGEVHYDNYNGHWGSQAQLDKLLQRYAVEATLAVTESLGYGCEEVLLEDGSIELVVSVAN